MLILLPHVRRARRAPVVGSALRAATGAAVICWAATTLACAKSGRAPTPVGDSTTAKAAAATVGPIPVDVDNRSAYDVIVYVVGGGLRRQLGGVPPTSHASFTIPDTFTRDRSGVALFAYRVGSNDSFTSDRVVPQPGERLTLILQARLTTSILTVQ